jgi:hypothetical protein
MQFVLTGFTPDTGFRIFNFEGIGEDRSRIEFTVRTDLALTRKYGIQMQDLPLLCRGLLDRLDENEAQRHFVFSEEEMRGRAEQRAAEKDAADKKKAARKTPTNNGGGVWRGPGLPPTVQPATNLQAKVSLA